MDAYNEDQAVAALKRVAKRWPDSLWLFAAAGSLHVMRKGECGEKIERAHRGRDAQGVDPSNIVNTIRIDCDGGDW